MSIQTVSIKGFRFYLIDGEYYPSVTSIISTRPNPALEWWEKSLTPEQVQTVLEYTAHRGNLIHYGTLKQYHTESIQQKEYPHESADYLYQYPQIREEIKVAGQLFRQFKEKYEIIPFALEKCVWNDELRFAGRVDLQGYLIDEDKGLKVPILLDIKTSKAIWSESVSLQISAYNYCLNNWAEKLYCLLLHCGETTVINGVTIGAKRPFWEFQEITPNFRAFKSLRYAFAALEPEILRKEEMINI